MISSIDPYYWIYHISVVYIDIFGRCKQSIDLLISVGFISIILPFIFIFDRMIIILLRSRYRLCGWSELLGSRQSCWQSPHLHTYICMIYGTDLQCWSRFIDLIETQESSHISAAGIRIKNWRTHTYPVSMCIVEYKYNNHRGIIEIMCFALSSFEIWYFDFMYVTMYSISYYCQYYLLQKGIGRPKIPDGRLQ